MHGKPGTAGERTFLMVKPEGVARGLVSEIIGRWVRYFVGLRLCTRLYIAFLQEKRGYTLVGIKVLQPDAKLAGDHYADLSARPFFKDLVHYMSSSGPVVAMVWQGKDVSASLACKPLRCLLNDAYACATLQSRFLAT